MGSRLGFVTALALSTLSSGCGLLGEPTPDVANPKSVLYQGFTFDHPGNWSGKGTTETIETFEVNTFNLESKGSALVMVQVAHPALGYSPDEFMKGFMDGVTDAVDEEFGGLIGAEAGGTVPLTKTVMGEEWIGRKGRFTVSVLNERVPTTTEMFGADIDENTTVIIYLQAPNEDIAKVTPGFDQVVGSFAKAK